MKHLDMLGVEIFEGDFVVGSYSNMRQEIAIFIVTKLTPKTVALRKYDVKNPRTTARRYSNALIKLTSDQTKSLLFTVIRNLENN